MRLPSVPAAATLALTCLTAFVAPVGGLTTPPRPHFSTGRLQLSSEPRQRRSLRLAPLCDDTDDTGTIVERATLGDDAEPSPFGQGNGNGRGSEDPTESLARMMSLMGTSPRRVFLSVSSSSAIALAANLFGVTSKLLEGLPEGFVERSGLDSFYPRGDYKRVTVRGGGGYYADSALAGAGGGGKGKCSFLVPKEWVADTGLALAQARRRARALDYSMGSGQQNAGVLPDAAYGPPGKLDSQGLSNGDTNVSVIINNGVRGFSLENTLGTPEEAAAALLSSRFGTRRSTTLVSAVKDRRRCSDEGDEYQPVYQFEYIVDRGDSVKPLRAISVVAGDSTGDTYATLTVVSPEAGWEKTVVDGRLRRVAESFKML